MRVEVTVRRDFQVCPISFNGTHCAYGCDCSWVGTVRAQVLATAADEELFEDKRNLKVQASDKEQVDKNHQMWTSVRVHCRSFTLKVQ